MEDEPAKRAELLFALSLELRSVATVVELAFKNVEPGSADGAKADVELMELLSMAERARAESRRRGETSCTRFERAAGPQLDRLANPEMAEPSEQARAYRDLWAAVRPALPGVHAGEVLAMIERGTRMRATYARVARALSEREVAA